MASINILSFWLYREAIYVGNAFESWSYSSNTMGSCCLALVCRCKPLFWQNWSKLDRMLLQIYTVRGMLQRKVPKKSLFAIELQKIKIRSHAVFLSHADRQRINHQPLISQTTKIPAKKRHKSTKKNNRKGRWRTWKGEMKVYRQVKSCNHRFLMKSGIHNSTLDCTGRESEWKDIYIFCFSTSFHFQQRTCSLWMWFFLYVYIYI